MRIPYTRRGNSNTRTRCIGGDIIEENVKKSYFIALAGNPNVGKSTIFNELTRQHQHTGNWAGKTVDSAYGKCHFGGKVYTIADIPGAYSLSSLSRDEESAADVILNGNADVVIVVCDATCIERNLFLALQIMNISDNVILCINLIDEAKKKGVVLDISLLSQMLGIPVITCSARYKTGIYELMETAEKCIMDDSVSTPIRTHIPDDSDDDKISASFINRAHDIAEKCIKKKADLSFDRKADKIFTSRIFGYPIMILFLALIFWITIVGANYPSAFLSDIFALLGDKLNSLCISSDMPEFLRSALIDGVYRVLTWVISVMLPPMAIFFPLFSLLEDFGYLPRIAFNLDSVFRKANACGKQSLTM